MCVLPHEDLVQHYKVKWVRCASLFAEQLDLIGLVLLGVTVALILAMTLTRRVKDSWGNRERNYLCFAFSDKTDC